MHAVAMIEDAEDDELDTNINFKHKAHVAISQQQAVLDAAQQKTRVEELFEEIVVRKQQQQRQQQPQP